MIDQWFLTLVPWSSRAPPVQSRNFANLQFRAGFKQVSKLNYCTEVPQVCGMVYWGSAPIERLKTIVGRGRGPSPPQTNA